MGSVIRRKVINVFDIPLDILVHCVGAGLRMDRSDAPPTLEVATGDGLKINEKSEVTLDLESVPEKAETLTSVKDVSLKLEDVETPVGYGPTPKKLVLTKTVENRLIKRNEAGFIIDMVKLGEETIVEEYVFIGHTHPSYTPPMALRPSTKQFPNFYKQ